VDTGTKGEQPATTTPPPSQQTTQQLPIASVSSLGEGVIDGVKTVGMWILLILLIIIGIRILYLLIEKAFRYGYAFLNSHRLIFLKILLPRGDGKADREQEKELAKDMKEKI
jgi:hypothetical protein